MKRATFASWFDRIALRVFFFRPSELSCAFALSSSIRLGPHRELPVGVACEVSLWRGDGLAPHVGAELGLGFLEVQAGLGAIAGDEEPTGYQSKHVAKRGDPPHAYFGGRWGWLKVARSW